MGRRHTFDCIDACASLFISYLVSRRHCGLLSEVLLIWISTPVL